MNKVASLHMYTVLALLPAITLAAGSETMSAEAGDARRNVIEIRLGPPEDLVAEGWQTDASGAFVRTMENGVVVEIAHGDLARERALEALDGEIRFLQALEETDARQDARLLQLLSDREELARKAPAKNLGQPQGLCTGNAYFDYSAFQDFSYVFADARTTFVRWMQGATATTTTRVDINGIYNYDEDSGTGLIVESFTGLGVPTRFCSGNFEGMVSLSDLPNCQDATATFFVPLQCS